MKSRAVLTVVVLATAVAPLRVDAKCARTELQPLVLTTRDTQLPDDGGVLVGWRSEVYDDHADHGAGDPSAPPGWTAKAAYHVVALTRTSLAPGLSVYHLAAAPGPVTIEGKAGKVGTFSHAAKAARVALAAPAVGGLALTSRQEFRGTRRHATLTLSSSPPAAAAAVIVYRVTKAGNQAISFVTLPDSHDVMPSLEVFADVSHCGGIPDGSTAPMAGESVAFAWVDAFGRLSPLSKTIIAK